jgi:hypothetical protein
VPAIPSFEELAALEPRLTELLAEARACSGRAGAEFCASSVWYGDASGQPGLMERLLTLVSPDSGRTGLLGTYLAFAVAYDALWEALPVCRAVCACGTSRPGASDSHRTPARREGLGSACVCPPLELEAPHEASLIQVVAGG